MTFTTGAGLVMVGLALHCTSEGRFEDAAYLFGIAVLVVVMGLVDHLVNRR